MKNEQVERGALTLHGAYFGVATGKLSVLDQTTGAFTQVAAEDHTHLFAAPPRAAPRSPT